MDNALTGRCIRYLPTELVDQIIGFASDDLHTLQACSLTSRSWNAIGRSYIFREVAIADPVRLTTLEILLQQNPALDAYIREVTIGPFTPETHRSAERWVARVPENLPRWLSRVRILRFIRLSDAGEYCDTEFFAQLYYFSTVTTLILDDCSMNLPVMQAFASALPSLTDFVVKAMLPFMVTMWEAPLQLIDPHITTLVMDFGKTPSNTMKNFVDWFLVSEARNTVRSVHFGVTILDAKAVNKFLEELGSRLEHLGLHLMTLFESPWEHDFIQREIEIRHCTDLVSLTIDYGTTGSTMNLLHDVSATNLRTLSLDIHMGADGSFRPNFEQLLVELNGRQFRGLERLRFVQRGTLPLVDVQDVITKAFPEMYSRNVIRVLRAEPRSSII